MEVVQPVPRDDPSVDRANVRAPQHLPSVTVIVPTRDRPLLLARAVRAVLRQEYEGEIDCLVVFDRCAPVLPDVRAQPKRSLHALQNYRAAGASGARNAGAFAARGEILAFCDDDDEWLPNKVQEQVAALLETPAASAASCGIYVAHPNGETKRLPRTDVVRLEDLLRSRLPDIGTSTLAVRRRDFLETIGPFDEAIPGSYGEDYDWLLRAAKIGPIVAVRRPLARIHWHGSSFFTGDWRTIAAALTYLLDRHPEFRRDRRGAARVCGQIAFAHAAVGAAGEARAWTRRCMRAHWLEPRAYLALLVSTGVLSPSSVLRALSKLGRGI
jgi:glycosyltransferase involved in cell wall biosynthesis